MAAKGKGKPGKPRKTSKSRQPAKRGRPKKEIPESEADKIGKLAALGMPQKIIADIIGVPLGTLRRRLKDQPAILSAYKKGRAESHKKAYESIHRLMAKGNAIATIFYLKTQCGWSEKRHVEHTINPSDYATQARQMMQGAGNLHTLAEGDADDDDELEDNADEE